MLAFLSGLTLEQWLFYPLAFAIALTALGVVVAKNPLYGALMLVVSFFFLSALYIVLGAHLVGILQIIVYAGAIMVLFVFVIMLLALGDADLGKGRFQPFKVLGALFGVGIVGLAAKAFGLLPGGAGLGLAAKELPPGFGTVAAVGRVLLRENVLQFEAVSLLLLVAIVGSVVVAKGRI